MERKGFVSGERLPDLYSSVQTRGCKVAAVGADCHADGRADVAELGEISQSQPPEVVPLPSAEVGRAFLEKLFAPASGC